jgi:hypothetical protein
MEDDVKQRDEVHECKHGRDCIQTLYILLFSRCNAH